MSITLLTNGRQKLLNIKNIFRSERQNAGLNHATRKGTCLQNYGTAKTLWDDILIKDQN
jgi:hypothetical protein